MGHGRERAVVMGVMAATVMALAVDAASMEGAGVVVNAVACAFYAFLALSFLAGGDKHGRP